MYLAPNMIKANFFAMREQKFFGKKNSFFELKRRSFYQNDAFSQGDTRKGYEKNRALACG